MKLEYNKLFDIDYIKQHTPNLQKLSITLKRDKVTGIGLYATKDIKKGNGKS